MTQDFRLIGLSKPNGFTCSNLYKEDIFWPQSGIAKDRFDALFQWAKTDTSFWSEGWIAEIEYSGVTLDGIPVDGKVIGIKQK